MEIKKKTWPQFFEKILSGDKNFECRLADWECHEGDILILQEFDPETKQYTGREIRKTVTFVYKTKDADASGMWKRSDIDKYGYQIISIK